MTKLLFLATEDWFVRSHFMPLVRRAQAEGYEVAVAARDSGALPGVRVINMPFDRGSNKLQSIWQEISAVRALVRQEQPDLVHAIALKPILLSVLAGIRAARVYALTGRGYLGMSKSRWSWLAPAITALIARAVRRGRGALLVENEADRAWIEGCTPLPDARVTLMPGAGVDPARFSPAPEPEGPIVVGIASRLIWSKGIDVAVDAVRWLNEQGRDIRLHIAGEADPQNPEAVPAQTLERWRQTTGVTLLGRVEDIAGFWARTHIACFPTRGGEGLPRSLLEAAACARPLVVSDTPGCRDFVQSAQAAAGDAKDHWPLGSSQAGLIVPVENMPALALALESLADFSGARCAMGERARIHVQLGYTETHAANAAAAAWARLLSV